VFTIRQAVDETALFLAVSSDGKMINDLSASDIKIRDDNRPPERILQFLPQSKLPLRLAVLVDTSGSVEHRIAFEKSAAKKFLERVLNPESDLAFVAGFDSRVTVTQDFTSAATALDDGVDKLAKSGEGTSVFDAVHFACWKLAAYPDQSRVARVLVLLSDGEDNSSHRSLRQAIDAAEAAGITVYAINTAESFDLETDASQVLHILGQRSGGETMYPRSMRELDHYFRQLSDAIRSRYLIAYKPANFLADGSYHRLKITAERDGKHLQVHVRKGYYARLAWSHL
jgi:VWFA-related protein